MGVKEFLAKVMKKDTRFKELQKEMKMQKMLEDRLKPANERELERYYEEDRQERIKQELEKFRKRKQEETWHGKNILHEKNIFRGHKSVLTDNKSLLDNGKGVLNEKSIFLGKRVKKNKGGYFK